MSTKAEKPVKLFTIEEANATLPLVRAITSDLVTLARSVIDCRQRLNQLLEGREIEEDNPYGEELAQTEKNLEKDRLQLQEYVEELRQLGVEPKSATEGLIDFPSMMDDHVVYLCWKLGETEVLHWHELDAGFSGRQSLIANSIPGDISSDESPETQE